MTTWQPLQRLNAELQKIEDLMNGSPDSVGLRFHRAVTLRELGRVEEAKQAYLELLAIEPTHFGALNNLGALAMETGFKTAARTAYAEAVKHHPDNPMGHVNLANAHVAHQSPDEALQHFQIAVQLDPNHAEAHQGLARLLADQGHHESARTHRIMGYRNNPILKLPYRGKDQPIELLVLASAEGGAVPIWHHLDDQTFQTEIVFVDFYDANRPLARHQLVFNAIGDADLAQRSLQLASELVSRTHVPIINQPASVISTGRMNNAQRLQSISGVITPRIQLLRREALQKDDAPKLLADFGFSFPILLRSPGYHNGQFFMRVDDQQSLPHVVSQMPGTQLMVIQYLNSRQADGKIRKYRVMMIDGQIFPLHAAVSQDWKIHFVTADMAENPEHRSEDEAFLYHMPDVLGPQAIEALDRIQRELKLDYAGVDFGLNADGQVLLFEANATMVVNPPDPDRRWDYRRMAVQRVIDAIRHLLIRKAKAV